MFLLKKDRNFGFLSRRDGNEIRSDGKRMV